MEIGAAHRAALFSFCWSRSLSQVRRANAFAARLLQVSARYFSILL